MSVVGDQPNNWNPNPGNMRLISNYTWRTYLYIPEMSSNRYKFAANQAWGTSWGETNQSLPYSVPITGIAEVVSGSGNDIVHRPVEAGFYIFTFNESTRAYRIERMPIYGTNVLRNPSFEFQGTWNERAFNWEWDYPDQRGSTWGNIARRSWRAHSGSWEGALQGKWAGADNGGWWQDGEVYEGLTYEASAWFYADANWTANVQELKIEFYNKNYGDPISITSLQFQGVGPVWTQKRVRADAPIGASWGRVVIAMSGAGQNGSLQFDDIELRSLSQRSQSFNDWGFFTNDTLNERDDWLISTGRVVSTYTLPPDTNVMLLSRSGLAASLAGASNLLRTPQIAGGIGTIRFWYRHGHTPTNSSPSEALGFAVETSPNGSNWTTVATYTSVLSTVYSPFIRYVYDLTSTYVRVVQTIGTNRLILDDVDVAYPELLRRYQDFNDWSGANSNGCHEFGVWLVCTGRVTSTNALDGLCAWVASSPASNNYVQSPLFTNGVGEVNFYYRHVDGTNAITFSVQTSTDAVNWAHAERITGVTNRAWEYTSVYLYETNPAYVRILHETGSKELLLDGVDVGLPQIVRRQTFDSWPAQRGYGDYNYQGWRVEDTLITEGNAFAGQAAKIRDTVSASGLVKSAFFPSGVGAISFWYRWDETNGTQPSFALQTSTNGTNWITIQSLKMTNTAWQYFSKYVFDTTSRVVQLVHTSGATRAMVDDFWIAEPSLPANMYLYAWHSPVAPYTNDEIAVHAYTFPQFGADSPELVAYYRVGTGGAYTARGMVQTSLVVWTTQTNIPPQSRGTTVQYYVACYFGGAGSELTSPVFYPPGGATNPVTIFIPRNPSGKVWINEINYLNDMLISDPLLDTNEFIEICGPASWDVSGWTLELFIGESEEGKFSYYGTYTVPNNTLISNEVSGFGFYVFGDAELGTNKNITLTTTNEWDGSQVSDGFVASGVRLLNEGGGVEQSISYRGSLPGFTDMTSEEWWTHLDPNSLQLRGTGSYYTNFLWATNAMTPGYVNVDQFFDTNVVYVPDIDIVWLRVTTNVVIGAYDTNSWHHTPYYTTNVMLDSGNWQQVAGFNNTWSGPTNTLWFNLPTTSGVHLFRVRGTKP